MGISTHYSALTDSFPRQMWSAANEAAGAFGFEDMDLAKKAGREGSARLSMVKERLKKKASEKEAKKAAVAQQAVGSYAVSSAAADAAMAALLGEEAASKKTDKTDNKKMSGKGGKK